MIVMDGSAKEMQLSKCRLSRGRSTDGIWLLAIQSKHLKYSKHG